MRLSKFRNDRGEIWLNVASSHYAVAGFVNLDNHVMMLALDYPIFIPFIPQRNKNLLEAYRSARNEGLFARHDCRKPLPLPDLSVDHILCSHFLEHVYPDEAVEILKDFRRVLKPGATMHVIVPDLKAIIRRYLERESNGLTTAADDFIRESLLSTTSRGSLKFRLLEFFGSFGLQHRWMYTYDSMKARIEEIGFSILDTNETPSLSYRKDDDSVHVVAKKTAPEKDNGQRADRQRNP